MNAEQKLRNLGIVLPGSSARRAMYLPPVKRLGNTLFISSLPLINSKPAYTGKVGVERTLAEAQEAAKICIVNILIAVKDFIGDLDQVVNIVELRAFVNIDTGFLEQHLVLNTALQLLSDVFGNAGQHIYTTVGTDQNKLLLDSTIEIEIVLEIKYKGSAVFNFR